MKVVTAYPDGLFNWVDLSSTDIEGAKAFYTGLFGWEAVDQPTDMGGTYTNFMLHGRRVAGGGQMQPEMQAQGMPSVWTSYVKHDDADAVAARVKEAGGVLLMEPMDVMDQGRMLMAQDPTGAVFGVWQPAKHIGAELVNMPSTLVWNELQTNDIDAAEAFYTKVFDWTYQVDDNDYVAVSNQDRMQAGMMAIQESWGPVPPNWSTYFMVEDVEASAAKAAELGGTVMGPPMAAGEMGRFAIVQDPQGAVFTIMEFSGPVDEPPGA
jgi:predicted enzyme related to lactoylglutathione lyase